MSSLTFSGSLYSARQLARQLFSNLASVTPPRSHLIVEGKCTPKDSSVAQSRLLVDFYPYFRDPDDAATAFSLFDQDGNGDSACNH